MQNKKERNPRRSLLKIPHIEKWKMLRKMSKEQQEMFLEVLEEGKQSYNAWSLAEKVKQLDNLKKQIKIDLLDKTYADEERSDLKKTLKLIEEEMSEMREEQRELTGEPSSETEIRTSSHSHKEKTTESEHTENPNEKCEKKKRGESLREDDEDQTTVVKRKNNNDRNTHHRHRDSDIYDDQKRIWTYVQVWDDDDDDLESTLEAYQTPEIPRERKRPKTADSGEVEHRKRRSKEDEKDNRKFEKNVDKPKGSHGTKEKRHRTADDDKKHRSKSSKRRDKKLQESQGIRIKDETKGKRHRSPEKEKKHRSRSRRLGEENVDERTHKRSKHKGKSHDKRHRSPEERHRHHRHHRHRSRDEDRPEKDVEGGIGGVPENIKGLKEEKQVSKGPERNRQSKEKQSKDTSEESQESRPDDLGESEKGQFQARKDHEERPLNDQPEVEDKRRSYPKTFDKPHLAKLEEEFREVTKLYDTQKHEREAEDEVTLDQDQDHESLKHDESLESADVDRQTSKTSEVKEKSDQTAEQNQQDSKNEIPGLLSGENVKDEQRSKENQQDSKNEIPGLLSGENVKDEQRSKEKDAKSKQSARRKPQDKERIPGQDLETSEESDELPPNQEVKDDVPKSISSLEVKPSDEDKDDDKDDDKDGDKDDDKDGDKDDDKDGDKDDDKDGDKDGDKDDDKDGDKDGDKDDDKDGDKDDDKDITTEATRSEQPSSKDYNGASQTSNLGDEVEEGDKTKSLKDGDETDEGLTEKSDLELAAIKTPSENEKTLKVDSTVDENVDLPTEASVVKDEKNLKPTKDTKKDLEKKLEETIKTALELIDNPMFKDKVSHFKKIGSIEQILANKKSPLEETPSVLEQEYLTSLKKGAEDVEQLKKIKVKMSDEDDRILYLKESESNISFNFSLTWSGGSNEDVFYNPIQDFTTKQKITNIRILQDLLYGRARYEQTKTGDYKIKWGGDGSEARKPVSRLQTVVTGDRASVEFQRNKWQWKNLFQCCGCAEDEKSSDFMDRLRTGSDAKSLIVTKDMFATLDADALRMLRYTERKKLINDQFQIV